MSVPPKRQAITEILWCNCHENKQGAPLFFFPLYTKVETKALRSEICLTLC